MKARICGVPEHFNLPWEHGIKDLQAKHDLTWTPVPGGSGAMTQMLADSEVDVAVMLTLSTEKAIRDGLAAKVIGTHVPSPLRWGIHVAADSDIKSAEQIEGRTYAISRFGSGSHLVAMLDANLRGWDTSEMKFHVVGTLEGGRQALLDGSAEVFFWEEFMTHPLVESGDFRCVDVRHPPWSSFVVVARLDWLAEVGDEFLEVLDEVNRHALRLSDDPEGTARLLAERFSIDEADGLRWLELTDWRCTSEVSQAALESARLGLSLISSGD